MGALVLFIVGTMVIGPIYTALALAAFFFISHLFSYPRILIISILIYVSFADLVRGYTSTKPFTLALILIFSGVTFFLLVENVLKRGNVERNPEEEVIRRIALYLLLVTVVSIALHNSTRVAVWFRFAYMYMLHIPILLYSLRHVRKRDYRKFFRYLTFLLVVQLLMNGAWKLHINPLPNIRMLEHDFAYGTLQSCRFVALLSIAMLGLYIALFDDPPSRRWKWGSVVMAFLCMVQFYYTYTNHMYASAALLFLLVGFPLMKTMKKRLLWIVAGSSALVILISVFMINYKSTAVRSGESQALLSPKQIQHRMNLLKYGPKGESYRVTFTELHGTRPFDWMFGVGPGMYMSKPAFIYVTPLAWQYMGDLFLSEETRDIVAQGGVNVVPMFGVGVVYGELGILGFVTYFLVFLYPIYRVARALVKKEYEDRHQRALAIGFICFVTLFLIENFGFDWFDNEFSQVVFAIWAAVVWVPESKADIGNGEAQGNDNENSMDLRTAVSGAE